jgi:hypothetical protein
MLRGSFAFLVLVVCAVVGAELREALAKRGLRAPAMEGLSFLLVGVALGGHGLGLFPEDLLAGLRVVVLVGLAWIGLVLGVQMDLRVIRRVARRLRWIAILTPLCIGGPVALAGQWMGLEIEIALAASSLAMASSPSMLESLIRSGQSRSYEAVRWLKLVMAFTGIPSVVVFAVAAAIASPLTGSAANPLLPWELILVLTAVGTLVGYALVVLVRGVTDHMQLLTLTIGGMCVIAGLTAVVGLSALPAAVCAGVVVVNRSVFPHRLLRVVHSLERPMVVALLVVVGASWLGGIFSWQVFVVLTVVRAGASLAAGWFVMVFSRRPRVERDLGLGLVPQGELAFGLLVAVVSFFPSADRFLEAAVAAVVCNNLAGGLWLRRRLAPAAGVGAVP